MIPSSRIFIVSVAILSMLLFSSASNKTDNMTPRVKIVTLGRDHVLGPTRPFDQGHASTIVRTNDNHFLIAWFGGTHEKHDDVAIWMSKGNLNKWSPPRKVAKIRDDAHWNPVLSRSATGMISLFFKVGKTIDEWETWITTSTDDGETWSTPRELVAGDHGGRGPVRNKPIQLSNGTLLAG
ncbi:MAG TPA: exo-alpha-sialidase, partial [Chryseolinea sp.]|nr:exo-alpha-sialidase [Chryseolinea sp.]